MSAGARREAERRFAQFVAAERAGRDPDPGNFLDGAEEEVRREYRWIVEDYLALRSGRATGTDSAAFAGPGRHDRVGDYRLIREIGRGGMGVVWEAHQESLGRRVALKLLHPHYGLADKWIGRFQQEAKVGGRLSHSGVVTVFHVGEERGTHYIAQELVPGGRTLAHWIHEAAQAEQLPPDHHRQVAAMFVMIGDALAAAHAEGVVHRDVKPGNVLLEGDQPKVADFGLARAEEDLGWSQSGEVLGTPYYMSPEQAAGRRGAVDARTDVWGMGATLYEALTLRVPFPGDTREQVVHKILHEEPVDPRRIRSRVPRDLAVICGKALERNPQRRYADAGEMAEDLRRFLADRGIRARPPGPVLRAAKWVRRHPATSAAGGVAAAALVVITSLFLDARAARLQSEADAERARQQRRVAERIEGFLVGLFEDVGPGGNAGLDTPAGELLARGTRRLEGDLQQDPVVRAALLMALGSVYAGLGEHQRGEELLRRALELHERALGEVDQRTLRARNLLAGLLQRRAKYEEAEHHYRRAQAGHEELYGRDAPRALENQGHLASLLWAQGRLDEAEPLLRNSLEGTRRVWGEDHFHTWTARGNLAALLHKRGKHAEAEPLFEELLAARRREAGDPEDAGPASLNALRLLADTRAELEKFEEAVPLYEELLVGCIRTYGPEHPDTAATEHQYGDLLRSMGRHREAAAYYRRAWEIRGARLRPGHPATPNSLHRLVEALHAAGRAGEALPLAERLAELPEDDAGTRRLRVELLERVRAAAAERGSG